MTIVKEKKIKAGDYTQQLPAFLVLLIFSVVINYKIPATLSSLFFLGCLVAYFFSENEPFWLAFFLVLGDGFFGLFGPGQVLQSVIPGLPEVEVIQLYFLLTILKAFKVKNFTRPFYSPLLSVLLIYLIFLIIQGFVLGLSTELNIQFRLVKYLLPLFLLYAIPRLFTQSKDYEACLTYLFPVAFLALAAQIITILTGLGPLYLLSLSSEYSEVFELTDVSIYRGFYNVAIVLITTFGALYLLAREKSDFTKGYLFSILVANGFSIFLSATRGWIIGFSTMVLFFMIFVSGIKLRLFIKLAFGFAIALMIVISIPALKLQINNAFKRIMTLEAIAEGDLTAKGTLIRLERRVPRVMKKWKESPITGWGFSNEYFQYADGHVGNHNLLLHSGLTGAFLMLAFFIHFNAKIITKSLNSPAGRDGKKGLLVFSIFFLGWFIIHSTSWQYFSFYQDPNIGTIQALFLSWGAIAFHEIEAGQNLAQTTKSTTAVTPLFNIYV